MTTDDPRDGDVEPGEGERVWEVGWEGHTRAQRERLARLPLWEKLEWLEEAQRVVEHLAKQRGADDPRR
jgi:hypothetical protein